MKQSPMKFMIPVAVLCGLLSAAFALYSTEWAIGAGVCSLIVLAACAGALSRYQKSVNASMDEIFEENATAAGRLVKEVHVPCMVFHEEGQIVWRNEAMKKLYEGTHLRGLPAACHPKAENQTALMEYAGGAYQVVTAPVHRERTGRRLLFQYWLDRTEAEHYRRLFEEQMPYVALIYIDNYEELSADIQFHRNTVITEVERLVSATAMEVEGIYRRYESGRFLLVFEAKHLQRLEKERFPLLEKAHKLDTGTEQTVTLSIAVGAASRVQQADTDARHAMELALGRGGDQAVVKAGTNYAFYGGRKQLESSQSRVRTRLFAKALRQLIENSSDVFIMGHKQPDMDCVGAALGIARCALHVNCRPHIVLDSVNPTIQHAVEHIRTSPAYAGMLVAPEAVKGMLRSSSVLIIVDTQRSQSTLAPELLKLAQKMVLIDHHRRSADYIDSATLNYLEARASSASEMVTEIIQYFHDNVRPTAFECSTLLAGITVDTKHFAFNVGARTFEAAAYLRQHGADISMVKLMFQDDRQTYADRVDTVKAAVILCPGVAVSACREDMGNASLIAAQAADALISIRGIEASFVLCVQGDGVNVSGRSLGRINVQVILERVGGGGHLTMAGAQLANKKLDEGLELVKTTILAYVKELEQTGA